MNFYFNITPIGRLDLGYTNLFGFEVSDNIQFNENKLQPFGSLKFITDFSNKSDVM